MRLAVKISIANAFVMLILVGVAIWAIVSVTQLSVEHRTLTVRTAETLRLQVATREAVVKAHRLELRNLVFDDAEYAAASTAEADRVTEGLDRLRIYGPSVEEQAQLEPAIQHFAAYRALAVRARELHRTGARAQAEGLLAKEGGILVDGVLEALDRLIDITQVALDRTQVEATSALGQLGSTLEALRMRTWTAVSLALLAAFAGAVTGIAFISMRMTRALRQLSDATRAVAAGQFREAVVIDTQDEIADLARSFNVMAARLREIDEMKERFYATMSHELRSPLMSIREAGRLMREGSVGPVTERQERLLAIIDRGGERLLRLVNEVLDLSRAEAGLLPLQRQWFDLRHAARRAVDELRPQAEQRNLYLLLEEPAQDLGMFGDEERLVQVVVNLVANALRFTATGGVRVRLSATDAEALIEVEDTGIGIRADLVPLVFDRFRQAHTSRGGSGLGLALVRALVDAHGGRVTAESQEGKGSRFTVILPRRPVEPVPASPVEA